MSLVREETMIAAQPTPTDSIGPNMNGDSSEQGLSDTSISSTAQVQLQQISTTGTATKIQESSAKRRVKKCQYIKVIARLFVTVMLLLSIFGTLKSHQQKGPLTQHQKYAFNALMILLVTLLGLNMTITYGKIFQLIREGIVTKQSRNGQKRWPFVTRPDFKELCGLRNMLRFLRRELLESTESTGRAESIVVVTSFILLWLLFNMGIAIGIALIGLTFSLEEGGCIGIRQGFVEVVDTTHFYQDGKVPSPTMERSIAKYFADVSFLNISRPFRPADPSFGDRFQIEELEDGWSYNFLENSAVDRSLVVRTDRSVTASANCTTRRVHNFTYDSSQDMSHLYYYAEDDELRSFHLVVGRVSTTYLAPVDPSTNSSSAILECDDDEARYSKLVVAEIGGLADLSTMFVYECRTSVRQVTSATLTAHQIPDNIAIIAATSLAHSGATTANLQWMYSYYAHSGFEWGDRLHGDAQKMAKRISKASAAVFAVMDQANPRLVVPGLEPWRGILLKVQWPRAIGIVGLVILGVMHMLIAFPTIVFHKKYHSMPTLPNSTSSPA
ncbi:hypothetical protein BDZ91DRAFT_851028 [Kalaharituber pfeilii]|nr:hypothetical protein BDZ91DRAFT_851028 [Kalaharituber pfeilii]